jgi:isoquinoline 1-oxidoreductase
MEPRTALAEWNDGKLTVWTGTQGPFGYHAELVRAFRLSDENVRVIVPDFGCGFGGKHTGEAAVEAARLAQAAGKPVLVRWTREEEFTWAYFRPAAVIDAEASLDANGKLTTWHFVNINSGGAAVDTPYRAGKARSRFVSSSAPLRQGSYRALAATANNFARESFMDELAAATGQDPLDFRLAHLEHPRLRAVLEEAAKRFNWRKRVKQKQPDAGVGLACGTEKGSYVAACVEIAVDRAQDKINVRHVTEVFECGAVVNPDNLTAQVQGCIIMGLGPALREEMRFAEGQMRNAVFSRYLVPRLADVPELDIHLLNRPDLESAGGGETPVIAIAPAIANALFHATGQRVRQMPTLVRAAREA